MARARANWTGHGTRNVHARRAAELQRADDGRAAFYIRQILRRLDGSPVSGSHFCKCAASKAVSHAHGPHLPALPARVQGQRLCKQRRRGHALPLIGHGLAPISDAGVVERLRKRRLGPAFDEPSPRRDQPPATASERSRTRSRHPATPSERPFEGAVSDAFSRCRTCRQRCVGNTNVEHKPADFRAVTDRIAVAIGLSRSGRRDLNPRPPAPKAGALPGCATPRHSRKVRGAAGRQAAASVGSAAAMADVQPLRALHYDLGEGRLARRPSSPRRTT